MKDSDLAAIVNPLFSTEEYSWKSSACSSRYRYNGCMCTRGPTRVTATV